MTNKTQPDLDGIKRAGETIRPYLAETPLIRSEILSQKLEGDIWLKYEFATPIASFKIRGALNAAIKAHDKGMKGVVTSSTGNHGQGVAFAARLLGVAADIFLPKPGNPVKAQMIQAFGGTLHEIGDDFDIAKSEAIKFADDNALFFVNDGEDIDVMEGAGTIGYEIARQLTDIDLVLIPLGGGNLAGGVSTAVKALQPQCRLITVQAKGSPAMTESFHLKSPVERPIYTIADGLVTRVPPSLALSMMLSQIDDAWLATDEELLRATHTLINDAHLMLEPAGAASLAGAVGHPEEIRGKRVVFILTGANITPAILGDALAGQPLI